MEFQRYKVVDEATRVVRIVTRYGGKFSRLRIRNHSPQLRRRTRPQLVALHALTGGQQRAGTKNATALDHGAVQYGRCHADEGAALEGAAMEQARVPHSDLVPDDGGECAGVDMDDGSVLDVGPGTDPDDVGVAPQNAVEPDAGLGSDLDLTDQR